MGKGSFEVHHPEFLWVGGIVVGAQEKEKGLNASMAYKKTSLWDEI